MLFSIHKQKYIYGFILLYLLLQVQQDLLSQVYEFSLVQRRRYNQIHVEFWVKSIESTPSTILGNACLALEFNSNYLRIASPSVYPSTDTINYNINKKNPIDTIISQFNNTNGYYALSTSYINTNIYSLNVNLITLGQQGYLPSNIGKGSLVGKIIFDIIGNPKDTSYCNIKWSTSSNNTTVYDLAANDIKSNCNFIAPSKFPVIGISILSPSIDGQIIDMNNDYLCLSNYYSAGGYPIYFERSVSPMLYKSPSLLSPRLDERLAYCVEYSLNSGSDWNELGRVVETTLSGASVWGNSKYVAGDILAVNNSYAFTVTEQTGAAQTYLNYRNPVRIIWKKDKYYADRSESVKLKITQLDTAILNNIDARVKMSIKDSSLYNFVIGKMFFAQLNGSNQYFKTENTFSNSTQLTVEAWINLSVAKSGSAETGIIASSAGPDGAEINGSSEGAWLLYLKNGKIPAFRVREIQNRGSNGYLAQLAAYSEDPAPAMLSTAPLGIEHSKNWTHIAATVADNLVVLYVNGEIVDKYTNENASDIRMLLTNHPIWIGINPNANVEANDYINAGIKEVRVWRVALSQEEIRKYASGLYDPSNTSEYGSIKRALQFYYSFDANVQDLANNSQYQNADEILDYYNNGLIQNNKIKYRPDIPHIKITSPIYGSGIVNLMNETTEIRWIGFGVGDISKANSRDIEIQYSIDGAKTWFYAKDPSNSEYNANYYLDLEANNTLWKPYNNNNSSANLRTINPFYKDLILRIKGTDINQQADITCQSDTLKVAPYFSIKRGTNSILMVDAGTRLNFTGTKLFLEAWIRPYIFPQKSEVYFPLISKTDSETGIGHYALRLLYTGQLQLALTDNTNKEFVFYSDSTNPVIAPNSIKTDSCWTHVGVYVNLKNKDNIPEVIFYIDGNPQIANSSAISSSFTMNKSNTYPVYIGNDSPINDKNGFLGEIRELRFWSDTPNNVQDTGNQPTDLSLYIQSAQALNAESIYNENKKNLRIVFPFDGATFNSYGWVRRIKTENDDFTVRNFSEKVEFLPCKPYIKLVEPLFNQKVENDINDLRLRWVGFNYDGNQFKVGDNSNPPAIEYSIQAGGGTEMQPYQYITSLYTKNSINTLSFPDSNLFKTDLNGNQVWFAAMLDVSMADPDFNNDGYLTDPGPISAALTNARLRLTGQYSVFNEKYSLKTEGQVFSIIPKSNFTVRVILEGYHNGLNLGNNLRNIDSTFEKGAIKIKLYENNNGSPGKLIDSAISMSGYEDSSPANFNAGNKRFANVNFVFPNLSDGYYWVLVEHKNHLGALSRFPAPFKFSGDNKETWYIESGWDFTSWDGIDYNILGSQFENPFINRRFTAYGNSISNINNSGYLSTGLVYNNGCEGRKSLAVPALIAGDVVKDNIIDSLDRNKIIQDEGTYNYNSDITGDNYINADDRTIVSRNIGRYCSYNDFDLLAAINKEIDESIFIAKYETNNHTLATYSYQIEAIPTRSGSLVELTFYIKNNGSPFKMGNATFAISYNPSVIKWQGLYGSDTVRFSNSEKGYAKMRSAPSNTAENPENNLRTIEIDFQKIDDSSGEFVPFEKTYLGTMKFGLMKNTGIIAFKWHNSTSVHTSDTNIITNSGSFADIKAIMLSKIVLSYPNGAEQFRPSKQITIKWSADIAQKIFLEFSSDGANSWKRITSDTILASLKQYEYILPVLYSSNCYIRIVDAESLVEIDRSDAAFAIIAGFAQIVQPSENDIPYIGGSTSKIYWACQGYEYIYFDFSSNNGSSWNKITGTINASTKITTWSVPKVTTKQAIIRMIDAETNQEIARSGLFKVLAGSIVFTKPRENEILIGNSNTRVMWNNNGVTNFDLYLSIDGGNNWTLIKQNTAAQSAYIDWKVENILTDKAVFKALWQADQEMEFGRSGIFSIKYINDVLDKFFPAIDDNNIIVYPNPSLGYFCIEFNSINSQFINLYIYDSNGKVVFCKKEFINQGKNKIYIDVNQLSNGDYYIKIDENNHSKMIINK